MALLATTAPFTALVVDDDPISRELLVGSLRRLGCAQAWLAENGVQGHELAQVHQPDYILLDIYMPEAKGWSLVKPFRQVCPSGRIIMVTSSSLPQDFLASLDARADGHCIKPVSLPLLARALANAQARTRAAEWIGK